jgi:single-stranded-DNA-specific exonuclease
MINDYAKYTSWISPISTIPSPTFLEATRTSPLTAQILLRRGITSPEAARAFLYPEHYTPTLPDALPDIVTAAQLIEDAVARGARILVWGDFDVDGQTAVALLLDALRGMGADVAYYIPDRMQESHGVHVESLDRQIADVEPAVLLTCDTGVSAHAAIDYAKSRGLYTVITDHHDLPPTLPGADAIVNPKRLEPTHPLATLPGVGVVFKLVEHLYRARGRDRDVSRFLDLVALGIVADVASQTGDTRYLLQLGLRELQRTRRVGLHALAAVAGVSLEALSVSDIAFQLAPRLNAAGRLSSASLAVELLTATDVAQAQLLATQLEGLNSRRRLLNQQILTAAQECIARDPSLLDWTALVIEHPAWHSGVIGIVASQLAERYQRPVVLLSVNEDGIARGSARSSAGYDIGAAIASQADLLLQFGGHPGAAGMSLPADNVPAFRRRLSAALAEQTPVAASPSLTLDAEISLGEITIDLIGTLNRLGPFGEGNPPITRVTPNLTLRSAAHFGADRQQRRLTIEDETGNKRKVVWWNGAGNPLPEGMFDLAYQLDTYPVDGQPEPQLTWVDCRRSAGAPVPVEPPKREIVDLRLAGDPRAALAHARERYPDAAVWAEGFRQSESPGVPLAALPRAEALIVYTCPPAPQALRGALEQAQPTTVILIGAAPPFETITEIQRRILELVKYVLNRQAGRTTIDALASAVGHTPATVRGVLELLEASGDIALEWERNGGILIRRSHGSRRANVHDQQAALEASVAETAAYRAYFRRAAAQNLLGWET